MRWRVSKVLGRSWWSAPLFHRDRVEPNSGHGLGAYPDVTNGLLTDPSCTVSTERSTTPSLTTQHRL